MPVPNASVTERAATLTRLAEGVIVELSDRIRLVPGPLDSWGQITCEMEAEGFDHAQVRRELGIWLDSPGLSGPETVQRALRLRDWALRLAPTEERER